MADQEEEILGKIEQAHERGEHSLGPFAGCAICARIVASAPPADSGSLVAELARSLPSPSDLGAAAAPGNVRELPDRDDGEPPSLADMALGAAQQALDDLEALAERGIVVPNAEQAVAHALVGVVHGLAAIQETLAWLTDYIVNPPQLAPPAMDTAPAGLFFEHDQPPGGSIHMKGNRWVDEGDGPEEMPEPPDEAA